MTSQEKAKEIYNSSLHDFDTGGWEVCGVDEIMINRITQALEEKQARIDKLRTALQYYASEDNWYNVNAQRSPNKDHVSPILKMVIGSVDTEGDDWLGGRTARQALEEDK